MYKKRLKIFFGIILISFIVIFCRLFYVQIIQGGMYSGISDKRKIRTVSIDTLRGSIYDRNGSVLAVDKHSFELTVMYKKLVNAYSCFEDNIIPKVGNGKNHAIKNWPDMQHKITGKLCSECHRDDELWVEKVSEVLEMPFVDIYERIAQIVEKVESIKRDVERRNKRKLHIKEETVPHSIVSDLSWERVATLNVRMPKLPGIQIEAKSVRWYSHGSLAPHIIGNVGELGVKDVLDDSFKARWFDSLGKSHESESKYYIYKSLSMSTLVGKSGVEKVFNSELMGVPGERFEEITLDSLKVDKLILERPPIPGHNIVLSIDSRIQRIAEKALGNKKGSIVLMDPWNGEIIAMATFPRYNLNTLSKDFPKLIKNQDKPFLNRPIQSVLSPGSVFKIIVAIAGLEEKKISERTQFACNGSLKVGRRKFRCFSKYGHGLLNIEEAIQHSCNVFFYEVGKRLGGTLLKKWSRKFGLARVTGIELPFEKKGNIAKSKALYETVNMSIGQGALLVTPLQMTNVMAIIANGGWYVKPHILKKVTDFDGNVLLNINFGPKERTGISAKNLDIIKHALRRVVVAGTARKTGLNKLLVAGKTGTTETGHEGLNHAWFCGYVPFEKPKYCFAVVVEYTPGHGAEVAGPIVKKLLSGLGV